MTRDDEIAEQYAQQHDAEHHVNLLAPGGEWIDPDSIRARLSQAQQEQVDQIIRTKSELQAYPLEDVLELGKQAI